MRPRTYTRIPKIVIWRKADHEADGEAIGYFTLAEAARLLGLTDAMGFPNRAAVAEPLLQHGFLEANDYRAELDE